MSLTNDLHHAVRRLRRKPIFTVSVVVTLALGIGAAASGYSALDAVVLHPLPFGDARRLVAVSETGAGPGGSSRMLEPATFLELRRQSSSLLDPAAVVFRRFVLLGEGDPELCGGAQVAGDLFGALGVRPLLGRVLPSVSAGADDAVVISHRLWISRFGGDPDAVGRTLIVEDRPYEVVGVMPFRVHYPPEADLWLGLDLEADGGRGLPPVQVVARLPVGVSLQDAQAELDVISARLARGEGREAEGGRRLLLQPLMAAVVRDHGKTVLLLAGVTGLVLLLACLNVANLLLAQAIGRRQELVLRAALGARPFAVGRPLLAESVLIALFGGAVGLVLAWWGRGLFTAGLPPYLLRLSPAEMGAGVVGISALLSLAVGILCSLMPWRAACRFDLATSLRAPAAGGSGPPRHRRGRDLLVVLQLALALVLLAGAGLVLNSLVRLLRVDPGFEPDHLLLADLVLPRSRYPDDGAVQTFHDLLLEQLGGMSGVESTGLITALPLTGAFLSGTVLSEDGPAGELEGGVTALGDLASPGYFAALGIPVLRGRGFTPEDSAGGGIAIVNQTLARRLWPAGEPVGGRIRYGDAGSAPLTVVGVVGDALQFGLDSTARPHLYMPLAASPMRSVTLVVRTGGEPLAMASAVERQVWALDPALPLDDPVTGRDLLAPSVARQRQTSVLLGVFAAAALLFASVGVYGAVADAVQSRTREIGVRMALGATPGSTLRRVFRRGLLLAASGVAIGLAAAALLNRFIATILFGVSPLDPLTLGLVALLLLAVSVAASAIPARRAAAVDPAVALRME